MPFGLTHPSAIFQGYINKILVEKLNILVIVYSNEIFIYTESNSKEDLQAIWWVLDELRKHLFYANFKKCRFHQDEMRFLDYIIFHPGIRMEEK